MYAEFEEKEGAQENFGHVGTQNLGNKGALEYFGQVGTRNLRKKRVR